MTQVNHCQAQNYTQDGPGVGNGAQSVNFGLYLNSSGVTSITSVLYLLIWEHNNTGATKDKKR